MTSDEKPWRRMFPYYEKADWSRIPAHMIDGVENYVEWGVPHMGSFLHAIMTKAPWTEVLAKADLENQMAIRDWAVFCTCYIPSLCWGSEKMVEKWIAKGGMKGIYEAEMKSRKAGND